MFCKIQYLKPRHQICHELFETPLPPTAVPPKVWWDNHRPQFCLLYNDNIVGDCRTVVTQPSAPVAFKVNCLHDCSEAARLMFTEFLLVRITMKNTLYLLRDRPYGSYSWQVSAFTGITCISTLLIVRQTFPNLSIFTVLEWTVIMRSKNVEALKCLHIWGPSWSWQFICEMRHSGGVTWGVSRAPLHHTL